MRAYRRPAVRQDGRARRPEKVVRTKLQLDQSQVGSGDQSYLQDLPLNPGLHAVHPL